ncbi:putative membrane protein [Leptolyngbya sp. PCC 7375]|nr:putative membrane protein [Leptolyngbya sp. PCC 7375]
MSLELSNGELVTPVFAMGVNGLPYGLPIHPNLVHLTLGLFIAAIAFDIVAALFPLDKAIFKFLAIPATSSNLYDVGWYNMLAAAIITFFTVTAGFYEILLADPPQDMVSPWGLGAMDTMVWHGVGGVLLLGLIVAMTVWRGFQRYVWRQDRARQVQWSYLIAGLGIFVLMFVHGTLGAHLGADFGLHISADRVIRAGLDPNTQLNLSIK